MGIELNEVGAMTALQFLKSYVINYKLLLITAVFAMANIAINFLGTKDNVYEQLIQVDTTGLIAGDFFSQIKKLEYNYTFKNNDPKLMQLKIMQLSPFIFNFVSSSNNKDEVQSQTTQLYTQLESIAKNITDKFFADCRNSINFLTSEVRNSTKFDNRALAIDHINVRTKPCVDIFNEAERIISKPEWAEKEKNHVAFLLAALKTDLDFLTNTLEKRPHFQITKSEAVVVESNISINRLAIAILIFHLALCAFTALFETQNRTSNLALSRPHR